MALQDTFYNGCCLLEYMSTPGTPFHSGLALFTRRAVYGHAWTDGLVSLRSAAILHESPFVDCVAVPADHDAYPSLVAPVAAATPELQRVFNTQAKVRVANRFVKLTVLYNLLWAALNVVGCGSGAVRALRRAEALHAVETWLPASLEAERLAQPLGGSLHPGTSIQSAFSLQSGQSLVTGPQPINGHVDPHSIRHGGKDDVATQQDTSPGAPDPARVAEPGTTARVPPKTLEEQLSVMDTIASNLSTLPIERHYVYRLGVVNHFSIHQRWLEKPNDVICHLCDTLLLP